MLSAALGGSSMSISRSGSEVAPAMFTDTRIEGDFSWEATSMDEVALMVRAS
jgi:hypothetical protein